jgi:FkbH-like protein
VYPQIGWGSKAESIRRIAERLNIGIESIAFVDDQPYELAEVAFALPEVLGVPAEAIETICARPEFTPEVVTSEASQRRHLYLSDQRRKEAEDSFSGPQEAFLASLAMRFTITQATREDLDRAQELTQRTNQLNTTGYTYGKDELAALSQSPHHMLLMAELDDRFGTYGKIGLALVEQRAEEWRIKLLLMSCRVMSRGVGSILIAYIENLARAANMRLTAEFIPTDRNRMMYVTYKFAGFEEIAREGDVRLLSATASTPRAYPAYVVVTAPEA